MYMYTHIDAPRKLTYHVLQYVVLAMAIQPNLSDVIRNYIPIHIGAYMHALLRVYACMCVRVNICTSCDVLYTFNI